MADLDGPLQAGAGIESVVPTPTDSMGGMAEWYRDQARAAALRQGCGTIVAQTAC
jgi:hypothetical protein